MDPNRLFALKQMHEARGQTYDVIENVTQEEADRIVLPLLRLLFPKGSSNIVSFGWTKDGDNGFVDLIMKKEE